MLYICGTCATTGSRSVRERPARVGRGIPLGHQHRIARDVDDDMALALVRGSLGVVMSMTSRRMPPSGASMTVRVPLAHARNRSTASMVSVFPRRMTFSTEIVSSPSRVMNP